jgi:CubicO group peptidase (beta-lactamase class C family)
MKKFQYFIFALSLLFPALSNAQLMTAQLNSIRTQRNLVGLTVGVACGDEVLETYYGGNAKIVGQVPITANTHFRVASISKSFTAAALMKLYDDGAFGLDDDISTALGYTLRNPQHPNVPITYRMLLSHRSSLQDGTGYSSFLSATLNFNPVPPITNLIVPGGFNYTPNMWRTEVPGSYFAYTNCGYGLIGTLIEALSGERFDLYVRDNILLPLGINGSFNIDHIQNISDVAVLYRNSVVQLDNYNGVAPAPFNPASYTIGTNGLRFGPQGSLRCTMNDLLTFGQMLLNGGQHNGVQILSENAVSLMLSDQWTFNGSNGDNYSGLFRSWGLGIHRSTGSTLGDAVFAGLPMVGHPGEAYGLISDLYIEPQSGLVLVFITNGYTTGGNYAPGVLSTFYRVEEQVFRTVETTYLQYCQNFLPDDCSVPAPNLQASVQPDGVLLTWTPLPGTVGCRVQGNAVGQPQTLTQFDIPGENADEFFVPISTFTQNLNYRWRVACACSLNPLVGSPWSEWNIFFVGNSAGIAAPNDANMNDSAFRNYTLDVFPNPVKEMLNISANFEIQKIEIFDISGRQMKTIGNVYSHSLISDLSGLPKGSYIIKASGVEGNLSKPIFIK